MNFIDRPYQIGETVAAVATAPGEAGVAVIRVSGENAVSIVKKIFSGPIEQYKSHTAHVGKILDPRGLVIDEVLVLVMRAPRSYTGEDTVEIHCHGGLIITRRVLEAVITAGARAALPGEFTFKAFMNKKIDLAQAEAVQELIAAKNELAVTSAEDQLQGRLSEKILSFQKTLTDVAAILEAWVDFPEEGLEFASMEDVIADLQALRFAMSALRDTFQEGRIIHEGLLLCLCGSPNVGKSSLMNALLGQDRAIVTPIAGTTRDLLDADIKLGGLHFRLVDTAGIRETDEIIEQEGIKRSKEAIKKADLVLLVLSATTGITPSDKELMDIADPSKTIIIWNKVDLVSSHTPPEKAIAISAKCGTGLPELLKAVQEFVWPSGIPSKEEVMITNVRHASALSSAIESLDTLISGLNDGVSPEFLASDMRQVLSYLGRVIGTDITEDILSSIFSKFCVGK